MRTRLTHPSLQLERIGQGREAEVFACGNGQLLRLMRDPAGRARTERQLTAMEAARKGGLCVPHVVGAVEVNGRPGLVMERLDGVDLLTLMGKRPWRSFWVGMALGRTHALTHRITAPGSLPRARDELRERIVGSVLVPRSMKDLALSLLAGLRDGDALYHGSFHPGNVVAKRPRAPRGETSPLGVIDWTQAARGHALADVAKTLLLIETCEPPPGTSSRVKALATLGRQVLALIYLKAYRRASALDFSDLQRWKFVQAVARLSEGVESERARLLRLAETQI